MVDDSILASDNINLLNNIKRTLQLEFKMKNLEKLFHLSINFNITQGFIQVS